MFAVRVYLFLVSSEGRNGTEDGSYSSLGGYIWTTIRIGSLIRSFINSFPASGQFREVCTCWHSGLKGARIWGLGFGSGMQKGD